MRDYKRSRLETIGEYSDYYRDYRDYQRLQRLLETIRYYNYNIWYFSRLQELWNKPTSINLDHSLATVKIIYPYLATRSFQEQL